MMPNSGYQGYDQQAQAPQSQQAPPPPPPGAPGQAQGRSKRVYASQQYEFAQGANSALSQPGGGYPQQPIDQGYSAGPGYQPAGQPAPAQWDAQPQYGQPQQQPQYGQPQYGAQPAYGQPQIPAMPAQGQGYPDMSGVTQGMAGMSMGGSQPAAPAPGMQVGSLVGTWVHQTDCNRSL